MAITGRDPKGRAIRTQDTAIRDAEACRLRSRGLGYQVIADQLGFQHAASARKAVQRAILSIVAEPAEELRTLQLQQLDYLASKALEVLEKHHITVSQGRVVKLGDVPLEDDGPVLAAIDRLLKIQERRAKLLGLDAPARHEVVSLDAIDSEIERLSAELGRTATGEAGAVAGPAAGSGGKEG